MINCIKTNSANEDFKNLVKELDAALKILDGDEHSFYNSLNKTDKIKHVIVAYDDEETVGCGAIREFATDIMEVKRMYVLPNRRGKGIASAILKALELWAAELGYSKCILETGKKQPEAIALYKKSSYKIIPSYGKYVNMENSICFEKILTGQEA